LGDPGGNIRLDLPKSFKITKGENPENHQNQSNPGQEKKTNR